MLRVPGKPRAGAAIPTIKEYFMPAVLSLALKDGLFDSEGASVRKKASDYLGIEIAKVRAVTVLAFDTGLSDADLEKARTAIFTNPVTQVSSFSPLDIPADWFVWVGLRPGVRDNAGATAKEAVEDLLGIRFGAGEAIYTSKLFLLSAPGMARSEAERLATELLANDIIQHCRVWTRAEWEKAQGSELLFSRVKIAKEPELSTISIESDEALMRVSDERNLSLNPADVPVIREYFLRPEVLAQRAKEGLAEPTDVEIEYIAQARSDHCNHNTFRGRFFYSDPETGEKSEIVSLFSTYIEKPTREIAENKSWVVSLLWDNAGVARLDDDHYYSITGETHNSPSNMEAYGGSLTGIVGVYRDPMGTGKGGRILAGTYGFCVADRDYKGPLKPRLKPRRLLDGIIEGVKDGGNKSGIPTPNGLLYFHPSYLGKCLVFVTALGIMPAKVLGEPSENKKTTPGDLIVMCGGRVGKDGIHGVTASSAVFDESTPAGHVQIGDPYTQKKMMDFLEEARDRGLIAFITDNGGGGLSSSVGESALYSNGAHVELEKVPLKYQGMDLWEIWVSESQERMTVAVDPENIAEFLALSQKHAVESTVIGVYTDDGKLRLTHNGATCALVDLEFLSGTFPRWEFEAEWLPPEDRGLAEPVLSDPTEFDSLILDMLASPNICSREWITRQYDHEVQGTSIIKPLCGVSRDVPSDAAVLRPVLTSDRGLALSQALLPSYSAIDADSMTRCVIDEALRRLIAVGADPDTVGGVDNFCWPAISFDPARNPDGKFKAAQLVRSCRALAETCRAYEIPLLSGKDSMYVDGHLPGTYGERHKVSALPTLMFTATGIVPDVNLCASMDFKEPGDLIYVLGNTRNELGASQYYALLGHTGANAPCLKTPEKCIALYKALHKAVNEGLTASVHGVYAGGLSVHAALCAMAGELGADIDLGMAPHKDRLTDSALFFSESAGRFIVSVNPEKRAAFEAAFSGHALARVGVVTEKSLLILRGTSEAPLVSLEISALKTAFKSRFGALV